MRFRILSEKSILRDRQKNAELRTNEDFPGGTVVGSPPANEGHTGSSPGPAESHMPRSN